MGRTKKKNNFLSFVVWVAIIVAACALIMKFVQARAFAVQYNGETLANGSGGIEMLKGEEYEFEVLNAEKGEQGGYTVKIVSTATKQTDFYYSLSGEWEKYSNVTDDLTKYFTIEQEKNSFSVVPNYDIGEILNLVHNQTVTIEDQSVKATADYFTMIVSLADESEKVSINFRIGYPLTLDTERLEF